MSRPYRSYRKYSSRNVHDYTILIWIILLFGTVQAYKTTLVTIAHWIVAVLPLIGLMLIFALFVKIFKKLKAKQRLSAIDRNGIDTMNGLEFEKYVAHLLKTLGYTNVRLTERFDLGVDIIATRNDVRWGIQVKRYNGLVKAAAVRQVVTALRTYQCDRAMVVSNSVFSRPARELATSNDCILVDRSKLSQWMVSSH